MRMGDIWGGLSASALVLPQAMAFGMTLWSPYTHDPAAAAMSGLVAAACLCVVSGLFHGTSGLVTAPTGPTLVLLAGAIAALAATGLTGNTLITATLLTVGLSGLFQIFIGGFKLGHLIKFIPYPVVSGFMTGSAMLMILSQTTAVLGGEPTLALANGGWIPLAAAGVTLATMIWLPRRVKKIPGTVLGLLIGTLTFHLLSALQDQAMPQAWVVGNLPGIADLNMGFDVSQMGQLPWLLMASSALALAVLASLDTLLTSVVADVATGSRHDARRELIGQGAGHVLSAFAGGMAGAGTTGSTLVAIQSGGRIWAGLVTGLSMVLLILLMGPVAAILPISVFAGIILHVAIFGMLDLDILRWMKAPQARVDGGIALIVTVVTVSYDLMVAVGLGVVLAVIEFIRVQVQSAVVQRRWTALERKSIRRRPKVEMLSLEEHGQRIVGYDLKGSLFFGTTDRLFDTMDTDLKQAKYIILDMRHVEQVDLTAMRLIQQMSGIMLQRGCSLLLAQAPKSMGLVKYKGHRHERLVAYHDNVRLLTFADVDRALEYAESALLKDMDELSVVEGSSLPLEASELMRDLDQKDKVLLSTFFEKRTCKAGDYLFKTGDQGAELFVIIAGEVEVLLPVPSKKKMRLAIFGPGMMVGELAFLRPGPRTADGRISVSGEVAVLDHDTFKTLSQAHSELSVRLLLCLGRDISDNLRNADKALRQLAS